MKIPRRDPAARDMIVQIHDLYGEAT